MKRILIPLALIALIVALLPSLLAGPSLAQTQTGDGPQADAGGPDTPPGMAAGFAAAVDPTLLAALTAEGGPATLISPHATTGYLRFVGGDSTAGFRGITTDIAAAPESAARAFLARYGAQFGLTPDDTLDLIRQANAGDRTFVHLQQKRNGVPVLAGELIIQTDLAGVVWSASGELAPSDLPPVPALAAAAPDFWYYVPALLGAPGPAIPALVRRVEVPSTAEQDLIDVVTGKTLLRIDQLDHAKARRIYDNNNVQTAGLPGTGPVRTEGQGSTGITDVDRAYDYAGDTYDFYSSRFGRDSLDGAGAPITITVRYCNQDQYQSCPYRDTFWYGSEAVFGQGFASADDIVAHELTHGVTQSESHLFDMWQSGALRESISDIFGEFVDLANGKGNDAASVRWLIGEDIPPAEGKTSGTLRSMSNPPQYSDPDRVGSANYDCSVFDNGGIHSNNGVPNKAAVLMTDGGAFNSKTITGLGLEKVAQIWYRLNTQMLTSGADFQDAYDLLPQACTDLAAAGVAGITSANCQQVRNAVAATEMNLQPSQCAATEAPLCNATNLVATDFWADDFENPAHYAAAWQSYADQGKNPWYLPQTANPYNFDMRYATSGTTHVWGDDLGSISDASLQMVSGVKVPAGAPYLRFRHAYQFDYIPQYRLYYDGGVLEYSANDGPWTDAGSLMTHNGYDATLQSTSNPLNGRKTFTGTSFGYQSTRLDLATLKGKSVRFRWRIGSDDYTNQWGWFIDDVRFYTCAVATPTPTPTRTPTRTPTPTLTPTPTRTPSTPWLGWPTPLLPAVSSLRPAQVVVQYGVVTPPQNIVATLTGSAVFEDGTKTQTQLAAQRDGTVTFALLAAPNATAGQPYTLKVTMGAASLTKSGKVGWRLYLPLLFFHG